MKRSVLGSPLSQAVLAVTLAIVIAGNTFAKEEAPLDPFMGDWKGKVGAGWKKSPLFAQVIALGNGQYQANLLATLTERTPMIAKLTGTLTDGKVVFENDDWSAVIDGKTFSGARKDKTQNFKLRHFVRLSPTLGKKPPRDATILFDGKNTDQWLHSKRRTPCHWKLLDNGAMQVVRGGSVISKKSFKDHSLHLEFRTPFMPKARGQGRGNSGVYVQGFYEVQVLDSYGLEGRDNECGGVYKIGKPKVNMCAPPMQWQTYDIEFTAPRFDEQGKKTKNARMTVLHNGVKIHDDIEVPRPTAANAGGDVKNPNGLYLQDHGNPVQYRNIWAVER